MDHWPKGCNFLIISCSSIEAIFFFYLLWKQRFSLRSSQITYSFNIHILQFSSELWMNAASPHTLYELQGNSLVYYIVTLACKRFSAMKPEHLLSSPSFLWASAPPSSMTLVSPCCFLHLPSPFIFSDSGEDWCLQIYLLSDGILQHWKRLILPGPCMREFVLCLLLLVVWSLPGSSQGAALSVELVCIITRGSAERVNLVRTLHRGNRSVCFSLLLMWSLPALCKLLWLLVPLRGYPWS